MGIPNFACYRDWNLHYSLAHLLIQRRITILSDVYLVKRDQLPNTDAETKKHQIDARTWVLLYLLVIGLVASVVGYVGRFSVVQNSTSTLLLGSAWKLG